MPVGGLDVGGCEPRFAVVFGCNPSRRDEGSSGVTPSDKDRHRPMTPLDLLAHGFVVEERFGFGQPFDDLVMKVRPVLLFDAERAREHFRLVLARSMFHVQGVATELFFRNHGVFVVGERLFADHTFGGSNACICFLSKFGKHEAQAYFAPRASRQTDPPPARGA